VVTCLEQHVNDLHMVQLMPLPPHCLLLPYIEIDLTFLVPACPGCTGKDAINNCMVSVQFSGPGKAVGPMCVCLDNKF